MLIATLLVSLYFAIPMLLGYICHITASPTKKDWCEKNARKMMKWRHLEYATAIFALTTAAFYIMGLFLVL
ncbi:hypothetical protein, partial [Pseudomonas brassicae]|uniref:hypothetical protein n=1 Tax=Pseudomonas brassicae TaxID=2708063 RepID=UPI001FB3FCE1